MASRAATGIATAIPMSSLNWGAWCRVTDTTLCVLFQNPGQKCHSITVKLVGQKTNRAAIGARIKVSTSGEDPQTVYRYVSSGSSFGGNPLQQTIGLGGANRISRLEVYWPTSGTTQVFDDVSGDQAIEITEFAADYRPLHWQPLSVPEAGESQTMNNLKP